MPAVQTNPVVTPAPRAFSLIELVLVLAILGVVTLIAAPRYASALVRYRADLAARRVVMDLKQARETARAGGGSVTITFSAGSDSYDRVRAPVGSLAGQTSATNLRDEPYKADLVSADFNGHASVVFDGYGQPDSAGTVVIRVGQTTRTVVLNASTGKASVQ